MKFRLAAFADEAGSSITEQIKPNFEPTGFKVTTIKDGQTLTVLRPISVSQQ